jgi:hypothetical protein
MRECGGRAYRVLHDREGAPSGVSHFPPLELPDVIAAEIERFIG